MSAITIYSCESNATNIDFTAIFIISNDIPTINMIVGFFIATIEK